MVIGIWPIPSCCVYIILYLNAFRLSHACTTHDQHRGHGQRAEGIDEVTLCQNRAIAVDKIAYSVLGQHIVLLFVEKHLVRSIPNKAAQTNRP